MAASVLVIGETPSLGRALADLLESDGVDTAYAPVPEATAPGPSPDPEARVIVVASNATYSSTARRWLGGGYGTGRLIVVGSRDPMVAGSGRIFRVTLPLRPGTFLRMVRSLLAGREPEPS